MENRGRSYRSIVSHRKKERLLRIISLEGYNPAWGYVERDATTAQRAPMRGYIKYPKNSNKQRFYKRYSNRIIRGNEVGRKGGERLS